MRFLLSIALIAAFSAMIGCSNGSSGKNGSCDSLAVTKAVLDKITSRGFVPDSSVNEILKYLGPGKFNYYNIKNLDTGPVDTAFEGTGRRRFGGSQAITCLNGKEGIYHELQVLVDHFNKWIQLGCERTDFVFALDASNNLNIIMVPLKPGTDTRYTYDPLDARTKALDLGDLHP